MDIGEGKFNLFIRNKIYKPCVVEHNIKLTHFPLFSYSLGMTVTVVVVMVVVVVAVVVAAAAVAVMEVTVDTADTLMGKTT